MLKEWRFDRRGQKGTRHDHQALPGESFVLLAPLHKNGIATER
jgi:hypothetical protein